MYSQNMTTAYEQLVTSKKINGYLWLHSDCQSNSDFCAFLIEIWSRSCEVKITWNAFFTNPIRATFICGLKSYSKQIGFSLIAQIGFHVVCDFLTPRRTSGIIIRNMLKVAAKTMLLQSHVVKSLLQTHPFCSFWCIPTPLP